LGDIDIITINMDKDKNINLTEKAEKTNT